MFRFKKLLKLSAAFLALSVLSDNHVNATPVPEPQPCKELEEMVAPTVKKLAKDAPTDMALPISKLFSVDAPTKTTAPTVTEIMPKPLSEDLIKDLLKQLFGNLENWKPPSKKQLRRMVVAETIKTYTDILMYLASFFRI